MKSMAALAVMLVAFVVAQAPVTQVDHWLHAAGRAHVATPLTSALLDEHHDHGQGQAPWSSPAELTPSASSSPPGTSASRQDRPPRIAPEHLA
jgi:hypothetical protein